MLISGILKDAFNGLQLTFKNYNLYKEFEEVTQNVQFGFGNENELARFIENRSNMQNFPLIWYVKPNYSRDTALIEKFRVNAKFVLMMSTDAKYYNDERSLINYENVLEPLAVEFYKRIKKHKLISLVSESSNEYDETQYGLDVYRSEQGQTKSATKLYVDAKIIEIELLVKKNCGIKVKTIPTPEPEPVENIPCSSEGRYYYQLLDKFNLNNVPINIRTLSASEITNMWLDNENYTSGIGQSGIAKCNQNFSLGDKIYVSSYDLNILPSTLNGYWLADNANEYITYGVIQEGELKNITARLAPTRTSISPVVIKAVSPKIVKIIDGIVTEVINLPTTGFSNSNF